MALRKIAAYFSLTLCGVIEFGTLASFDDYLHFLQFESGYLQSSGLLCCFVAAFQLGTSLPSVFRQKCNIDASQEVLLSISLVLQLLVCCFLAFVKNIPVILVLRVLSGVLCGHHLINHAKSSDLNRGMCRSSLLPRIIGICAAPLISMASVSSGLAHTWLSFDRSSSFYLYWVMCCLVCFACVCCRLISLKVSVVQDTISNDISGTPLLGFHSTDCLSLKPEGTHQRSPQRGIDDSSCDSFMFTLLFLSPVWMGSLGQQLAIFWLVLCQTAAFAVGSVASIYLSQKLSIPKSGVLVSQLGCAVVMSLCVGMRMPIIVPAVLLPISFLVFVALSANNSASLLSSSLPSQQQHMSSMCASGCGHLMSIILPYAVFAALFALGCGVFVACGAMCACISACVLAVNHFYDSSEGCARAPALLKPPTPNDDSSVEVQLLSEGVSCQEKSPVQLPRPYLHSACSVESEASLSGDGACTATVLPSVCPSATAAHTAAVAASQASARRLDCNWFHHRLSEEVKAAYKQLTGIDPQHTRVAVQRIVTAVEAFLREAQRCLLVYPLLPMQRTHLVRQLVQQIHVDGHIRLVLAGFPWRARTVVLPASPTHSQSSTELSESTSEDSSCTRARVMTFDESKGGASQSRGTGDVTAAEDSSIRYLDAFCSAVAQQCGVACSCTIVCDGAAYGDLFNIPESRIQEYTDGIRQLVSQSQHVQAYSLPELLHARTHAQCVTALEMNASHQGSGQNVSLDSHSPAVKGLTARSASSSISSQSLPLSPPVRDCTPSDKAQVMTALVEFGLWSDSMYHSAVQTECKARTDRVLARCQCVQKLLSHRFSRYIQLSPHLQLQCRHILTARLCEWMEPHAVSSPPVATPYMPVCPWQCVCVVTGDGCARCTPDITPYATSGLYNVEYRNGTPWAYVQQTDKLLSQVYGKA